MSPADYAEIFKTYGPAIGACAVLCAVVAYLHRGWTSCLEARIADAKVASDAIARQATTNADMSSALTAMREGQTEIMRMLALLQRDTENDDERVRERIEALTSRLGELIQRVDNICRRGGA